MSAADLLRETSLDNATLRALQKRGLIELREEAVQRDPPCRRAVRRDDKPDVERRAGRSR
jgi:hypothetical protein